MNILAPFRDPARVALLRQRIQALAADLHLSAAHPLKFMEVCGGHTHSLVKYGLGSLLPEGIELVHGPGCPVCVLPKGQIDAAIALAQQSGVILATFGDPIRVPGSRLSLQQARAQGADIRVVYSPLDALTLAEQHPHREVIFFAIGFETTAPATALTVKQAHALGIPNFSVFCNHIRIMPALEALLQQPDLALQGFIGPGHVSTVIGSDPYESIPQQYGQPMVIAGFEPVDILHAIQMLLMQKVEGRCQVEVQYARLVQPQGNPVALQAMVEVFREREHFEWRGLGSIPGSGYRLAPEYADWDAERRFDVAIQPTRDPLACRCGEVLRGAIQPWQCKVFGTACTPTTPIGACMVSSEGACAAYYQSGRARVPPG
ncbi:MAG: hydrogenase formation protein HypD [Synechococcales cyanobacterium]